MFKKVLSLGLLFLLIGFSAAPSACGATKAEKQAKFAEKVKTGIAKLGTGEQALVQLKLRDKTKVEGFISETSDEDFVVKNLKSGSTTRVAYAQVTQVKGNNLSTGAKIAIGVAILAGILAFLLILENTG